MVDSFFFHFFCTCNYRVVRHVLELKVDLTYKMGIYNLQRCITIMFATTTPKYAVGGVMSQNYYRKQWIKSFEIMKNTWWNQVISILKKCSEVK